MEHRAWRQENKSLLGRKECAWGRRTWKHSKKPDGLCRAWSSDKLGFHVVRQGGLFSSVNCSFVCLGSGH